MYNMVRWADASSSNSTSISMLSSSSSQGVSREEPLPGTSARSQGGPIASSSAQSRPTPSTAGLHGTEHIVTNLAPATIDVRQLQNERVSFDESDGAGQNDERRSSRNILPDTNTFAAFYAELEAGNSAYIAWKDVLKLRSLNAMKALLELILCILMA